MLPVVHTQQAVDSLRYHSVSCVAEHDCITLATGLPLRPPRP